MTAERTSEHKEKGCFISTAVVSNFNLPDDCRELNILRRFRDTYMRCTPERQQEVEEYYRIAPGIVEAVSQRADASDIWRALWASHLAPAIAAIECGDDDRAHSIYRDMVASLSHYWNLRAWGTHDLFEQARRATVLDHIKLFHRNVGWQCSTLRAA